jgi:hypothetical protein
LARKRVDAEAEEGRGWGHFLQIQLFTSDDD